MPPANTGSKGALVTWTVVATVFGITCMVLAIVAYSGQRDAVLRLDNETQRYRQVAGESELTSPQVASLRERKSASNSSQLDLPYAISETRDLAQQAVGIDDAQQAQQLIADTIQNINETIANGDGASTAQGSNLAAAAQAAAQELTRVRAEVDQLNRQLQQQKRQGEEQQQALRDQVQQTEQREAAAQQQLQEAVAANEAAGAAMTKLADDFRNQLQTFAQQAGTEYADLSEQLDNVRSQLEQSGVQLASATEAIISQIDPSAMTTQADGTIIRAPNQGRLTIDLGRAQGVTRGMTFAVYDSTTGVPRVEGSFDDPSSLNLPRGKASIEIISLGQTSSEARVVRQAPGATLRDGDLIANLAFDRNSPRSFYVYGDFDFDIDGQYSEREGQQIESLIREFGGEVVDGVSVDTDVVVLGRQPTIPEFTQEELSNPINRNIVIAAQQALREYQQVRDQAAQLNKTIINQNQLLALIGYYELSRR